MSLQAARAIYKDGVLVFADPKQAPQDGTEVIVTFLEQLPTETPRLDPIKALRGRGRGERLVERLLQSRREDRHKIGER
jgi:hypothetical protein